MNFDGLSPYYLLLMNSNGLRTLNCFKELFVVLDAKVLNTCNDYWGSDPILAVCTAIQLQLLPSFSSGF